MDDHAHDPADRFDFDAPRATLAITCRRVAEGAPVLHVVHDDDGDWQLLCGGGHDDEGEDHGVAVCLGCLVAADPTLNDVADLCANESASREAVGGAWARHDHHEDVIRETVAAHGWSVQLIPAGARDDEPPFAYTVGLFRTLGHAELIVVGLRHELMHAMLNNLGERARDGGPLPVDAPIAGVIEGHDVRLRPVRAAESYRDHVGYAMWFNGGREFPLLQVVWPDADGRFPGEPGADDRLAAQQPLLP
jgi:hypothetical protein